MIFGGIVCLSFQMCILRTKKKPIGETSYIFFLTKKKRQHTFRRWLHCFKIPSIKPFSNVSELKILLLE